MPAEKLAKHFHPELGRPTKELYSMAGLIFRSDKGVRNLYSVDANDSGRFLQAFGEGNFFGASIRRACLPPSAGIFAKSLLVPKFADESRALSDPLTVAEIC